MSITWPRRHRAATAVIAVLVVAAAAVATVALRSGTSSAAAPTTRTLTVSTGTLQQSVTASGTVEPAVQDALSFPGSGQVTTVSATAGQHVAAGQALATITSTNLAASLAQAQASLASAQAKVSSDSLIGASATQAAADEAAVAADQQQVSTATTALAGATLTSPIAGLVAQVNITVGQAVSGSGGSSGGSSGAGSGGSSSGGGSGSGGSGGSGSGSGSSTTVGSGDILVIGTSSWQVNASVNDTQVGQLAVGNQAQIQADGTAGTQYGTISSIGLIASSGSGSGSSSGGVATFPVTVKITGTPSGLHAGADASLSLIYKQLADVITVPVAAVRTVAGKAVVDEPTGQMGGTRQVAVTEGLVSGGQVQITSGLSVGESIVVPVTAGRTGGAPSGGGTRRGGAGFGGGGGLGGGYGGGGGRTSGVGG